MDTPAVFMAWFLPAPRQGRIQRVAQAMLKFGILGQQYAAEVERGTLAASMVNPAS